MSKEHEHAALGEAMAKAKGASTELAKLSIEARHLGAALEAVGRMLQESPERVVFDKESFDGRFHAAVTVQPRDMDAERLRTLVNEYRKQMTVKLDNERLIDGFKNS